MPSRNLMMMGAAGTGGDVDFEPYVWGDNTFGALGLGDTTNRSSPVQLDSSFNTFKGWGALAFGSVVVKNDNSLWSWGYNGFGALGLGNTINRSSPVQIGALTDWETSFVNGPTIAENSIGFVIKTDGTLWAWGANSSGVLGQGDTTNRSSPVQVGVATNWDLGTGSAGDRFVLVINNAKELYACGEGSFGRLGTGNTTDVSTLVQIGSDTNWSSVAAGFDFSFSIKTDGTLWAWGLNNFGQLGLGNTVDRSSPTQVGADTNWAEVRAGRSHTIARKTNGTIWSWGSNTYGELGLGDTTNRSSPVQIGSYTTGTSVGTSTSASYFIAGGKLYSFGRNHNGQLGTGNTVDVSSPVQVGAATNWYEVLGMSTDSAVATRTI